MISHRAILLQASILRPAISSLSTFDSQYHQQLSRMIIEFKTILREDFTSEVRQGHHPTIRFEVQHLLSKHLEES